MDSDIRNLYASFDGAAESYREVYREEQCVEAARRWRLLGKIVAAAEHPEAQMHPPLLRHAERALGADAAKSVSLYTTGVLTAAAQASAEPVSSRESFRTLAEASARTMFSASDLPTEATPREGASRVETTTAQVERKTLKSMFQRLKANRSELPPAR
ncbi:MAG: BcsR/BcsP family cellulose biosynthesis protein [Gammaproteobacteria bacterium]